MDNTNAINGAIMNAVATSPVRAPEPEHQPAVDEFASRVAAARHRLSRAVTPGVEAVPEPEAIGRLADAALNPVNRFLRSGNASARSTKHRKNLLIRVRGLLIEAGIEHKWSEVPITAFPWHCVDESVASKFTETVVTRYENPHSRSNVLSAVRSMVRHCAAVGLITTSQRERVLQCIPVGATSSKRVGRCIEADVLMSMLRAALKQGGATGLSDSAMIAVFASTGVRISELAEINVDDVDLEQRSIRIRRAKGGGSHVVWLHPTAAERVRAWIEDRGFPEGRLFFATDDPRRALHISSIRARLQRVQRLAGISPPYSSHDFRRTLITQSLRSGTDPFVVARLVGHRDVSTTLRYDRRSEAEDRAAVDKLDFRGLAIGDIT